MQSVQTRISLNFQIKAVVYHLKVNRGQGDSTDPSSTVIERMATQKSSDLVVAMYTSSLLQDIN